MNIFEIGSVNGLHVKIPENYFKILEEGKNVGKFIFRRSVKIPENDWAKVQKSPKMNQESVKIPENFFVQKSPKKFFPNML